MNIEGLSLKLEQIFRRAETETMQDIVRRILDVGDMTPTAEYQASRLLWLGESKKRLIERYSRALKLSKKDTEKLFAQVVKQAYTAQEPLYRASGKDFIPYSENTELKSLVQGVIDQVESVIEGETSGIANSGGFLIDGEFTPIQQYWEHNVDSAIMSILTGVQSKETVLKRTISQMTNSGIRIVNYDSGWHNRVDVAVRRAVQTGLQQVTGKINDNNAKALNTEYFEVEAHLGARPTHEVWQGKVYTKDELVSVCGLGDVTGLLGANCYHLYYPFVPGVSKRMYTDEQLEEMKRKSHEKKSWNGKEYDLYEAKQQQRKMETQMRAWREKIQLTPEGSEARQAYESKYRSLQDEYVQFSEQMGLPQQWQRVTQDARGTVVKNGENSMNSFEKEPNSDIIISGAISGALNPDSEEAGKHAIQYYESVRHMKTDAENISNNTEFTKEDIQKVKNFVFIEEHDLGGKMKRFDPDYSMAESWRRLIEGKHIQHHDILLIKHELFEQSLMKEGVSQSDAHIIASEKYNYDKEATDYYDKINEHKSN